MKNNVRLVYVPMKNNVRLVYVPLKNNVRLVYVPMKMPDFVSFPLFGFTKVFKLRNFYL